ncbi:Pol protein [Phytophthora palmivora]|uniref:Pol protein n=1 Tax=Phytophthora palmivora TaxID=4796 RepID=A0A2P4Y5S0_9STRA|nr:Pol protein [Phytophthora palmivora]
MDKYDLILGMLWLEKREPGINWRGNATGASRPAVSDRALVSNVPTSVRDWGARDGRQGLMRPKKYWDPNAENCRAEWASTVAVPDGTDQAGNIGPQAAEAAEESAKASPVWSEAPPARSVEEHCHVFNGVSGRQVKAGVVQLEALSEVSALLKLEELSMKDFLAKLKAGEIAEMVLLKPETSPEDLNSSSVMDEDVLEGFMKQREILKNPEDPAYPLVREFSDVVSKHPPS